MNCVELQQSLAEVEDGSSIDQRAHLRGCAACSALVGELDLIIAAAGELRAAEDPRPRVLNSIEIALGQGGLMRPIRAGPPPFPPFSLAFGSGPLRCAAPP